MSNYYNILKDAEKLYFSLKSISSKHLNGELVFFTRKGFRHFIRKDNAIRPISDQIRRLKLIKHIPDILNSSQTTVKQSKGTKYDFWSLSKEIEYGIKVKVLIGKKKDGKYYFFSIM